ncbi:flagellar operon protein TIGR03826 [Thermoanaerobacterium xylanolyticum LX-11]|uniref:Flagellar operon protein TIGR03826 n=1 Tax=Thermoanaerobacterium xylanolyticum (strain ATCC 49914 / DSM 7097 / LX-11) TaxID=858215 RepID=F6BJ97_THEXL|nr:TIGR03826 family flagellar region protein [Thermoanaerobacterium xylanolyticum]AEF17914.1 flagellar operon protein TIGR03826 [Thermoanaerobacterium xylanolyticum LX-11]
MDIKNCKRCGKLYNYTGFDLCPECFNKDEEDFIKIRDYIERNPQATVVEVSKATDVEVKRILDFLKEGRLILGSKNTNISLTCERCGKKILSGRYCESCSRELERSLKGALNADKIDESFEKLYLRDEKKDTKRKY